AARCGGGVRPSCSHHPRRRDPRARAPPAGHRRPGRTGRRHRRLRRRAARRGWRRHPPALRRRRPRRLAPRRARGRDGAHVRVPRRTHERPIMTTFAFQGPKRGADRAVLLAHGAGADLDAPALRAVADALADAKVPSLRFNYPYRDAGKKAPDRPAALLAATRAAVDELATRTKLPADRLVLGGRSMGG